MKNDPTDPIEAVIHRTEEWANVNIEARKPRDPAYGFACYAFPLDVLRIIEEYHKATEARDIRAGDKRA